MSLLQLSEKNNKKNFNATHDALTGLANRVLLKESLSKALDLAKDQDYLLAVFFIDLDGFKDINDKAGHKAGDFVLLETSRRLLKNTRATDLVARVGGDEFIIMLARVENRTGISVIADKILAAVASPYNIEGESWQISASIGIAVYPHDGLDADSMLVNSDAAMYEAKRKGKNKAQYFNKHLNNVAKRKNDIITEIRESVKNNAFEILLQPQYDIKTNQLIGAESFIRWHHPNKGIVQASKFLPYIANTEYINTIGYFVLNKVLEYVTINNLDDLKNFRVAINVEPRQLANDDFLNYLTDVSKKKKLSCLTIEITEDCFKTNFEIVKERLNKIRALGIKICLDDFGIGVSSLNHLIILPIDILKIDNKYFECNQQNNANTKSAIIALAHNLAIKVMAKRVDNSIQLEHLIESGCNYAQGYCYSEPLPVNDFQIYLDNS